MELEKSIYLVRHGQTEFNEKDLMQGQADIPLSETGHQEALALAKYLQHEPLDIIYSTPLLRAQQTASHINHFHQQPLEIIDQLTEINIGSWEGQSYPKIVQTQADFYKQWINDTSMPIPGGESFQDVYNRVEQGMHLIMNSKQKHILISGHATVNRAILCFLMKLPLQAGRRFRMQNCGFSKFLTYQHHPAPYIVVERWNDTSFLG
jgi:broad specificity phosphatase PhoE